MRRETKYRVKKDEVENVVFNMHEYGLNPYSREIYLTGWDGAVDEEPGMDYRMAMQFIKNITFLTQQGAGSILIHQSTVGGEWNYGMAIHNAIANCPCHVTMLCYGHARSMSSITVQAADKRVLMPDCCFMIHHGTVFIEDTHTGAVSYMEFAKEDAKRMMEIYTSRCKLSEKQILRKLEKHQEWYMSADEAVEHGFADSIYDGDVKGLRP